MRLAAKVAIGAVATAVVGTAAAVALGGIIPMSDSDTHPPCEQLPTTAQATAALTKNQGLAHDIEALGKGISVAVGKPCPAGQDRALIQVAYGSKAQRENIHNLLNNRDGFGVPVYLVEH